MSAAWGIGKRPARRGRAGKRGGIMSRPVFLLVAEDRAVLDVLVSDLRRRFGADYRVVSADSAAEALAALDRLAVAARSGPTRVDVAVRIHVSDDVTGLDLSSFDLALVVPSGAMLHALRLFADQPHPTDGVWELHGHLPRHASAGNWHVSRANVKDGGGRESNCQWLRDNTGGWQEFELVNDC
jgi:hypothetical protein